MNKKQIAVLALAIIGIVLIVIFTPRYKITWIDSKNFIKTEQSSPLYKRSTGKESLYWDKIALYSGLTVVLAAILLRALRSKHDLG